MRYTENNHHPFGMLLVGRSFDVNYPYGFNGKESDIDPYGQGNVYDYGYRIYNSRLGKFLSVDPLNTNYAYQSPYSVSANSPIFLIDESGLFPWPPQMLIWYKAAKQLVKKMDKTVVMELSLKAQAGVTVSSGAIQMSSGVAMDPKGNMAFFGTFGAFVSYYMDGGFGYPTNEVGPANEQWGMGASASISASATVYDFKHVKQLAGAMTSQNYNFSIWEITIPIDDNGDAVGFGASVGLGVGVSYGSMDNLTYGLFAFRGSDVTQILDNSLNAYIYYTDLMLKNSNSKKLTSITCKTKVIDHSMTISMVISEYDTQTKKWNTVKEFEIITIFEDETIDGYFYTESVKN